MKKVLIVLGIACLMVGCTNISTSPSPTTPTYIEELRALGYSEETIQTLQEKLTVEQMDKLTEYDYVAVLLDIINDPDFQVERLEDYLSHYEPGMNGSALVYLINNNISYTYNEKLASIMNHPYFIVKNLERYLNYDAEDVNTIIQVVNSNTDREFYTQIQPTDLSKGTLLITNKYYQLKEDYVNEDLVTIDSKYSNRSGQKLNKEAYQAFQKLVDAGEEDGVSIRNLSAYRSYSYQNNLYQGYLKDHGQEWTDKWSARPGHSEHQTGLALDVAVKGQQSFDGFENTEEFAWLQENAYRFGFILRYPENKTAITGYGYEPWHYRYVGVEAATYIYEHDITFEEYYAYFVEQEK